MELSGGASAGEARSQPKRSGLLTDALVYGMGDVAGRALAFISVPIYTRAFDPTNYSVLAWLTTASGLLASVVILGGDTTYARFFFQQRTRQEQRDLTVTWLGFLFIFAAACAALLLPTAPVMAKWSFGESGYGLAFALMLISIPLGLTSRMLAQALRNEFRPVPYAVTGFATSGLGLTFSIVLLKSTKLGVSSVLLGFLIADLVVGSARAMLVRDMLHGSFRPRLLPPLLRYGVPLVAVSLSYWTFTMSDRLVLGKLGGLLPLAHYSLAISICSILVLASSALASAWTPRAFAMFESDPGATAALVSDLLLKCLAILGLLAVCIATSAHEIVTILAPSEYEPAERLAPLLLLGLVANGSALLTGTGISIMGATAFAARYAAYAAVVNVVLALLLVPRFNAFGAAWASACGYTVLTSAYLWRSQRLWPISFPWRQLVTLVTALVASLAAAADSTVQHSPVKWVVLPAFFVVLYLVGALPPPWSRLRGLLRTSRGT